MHFRHKHISNIFFGVIFLVIFVLQSSVFVNNHTYASAQTKDIQVVLEELKQNACQVKQPVLVELSKQEVDLQIAEVEPIKVKTDELVEKLVSLGYSDLQKLINSQNELKREIEYYKSLLLQKPVDISSVDCNELDKRKATMDKARQNIQKIQLSRQNIAILSKRFVYTARYIEK